MCTTFYFIYKGAELNILSNILMLLFNEKLKKIYTYLRPKSYVKRYTKYIAVRKQPTFKRTVKLVYVVISGSS